MWKTAVLSRHLVDLYSVMFKPNQRYASLGCLGCTNSHKKKSGVLSQITRNAMIARANYLDKSIYACAKSNAAQN
jgi:hypothetical protein